MACRSWTRCSLSWRLSHNPRRRRNAVDFTQLLTAYGPLGAALIGAIVWLAKVYVDKIRPERLAREARIVEVVEKNTVAFVELRASIEKREEMERQRTEAQTAAMVEI